MNKSEWNLNYEGFFAKTIVFKSNASAVIIK